MGPADLLEGKLLEGKWRVLKKLTRKPTSTGGVFSTGYLIQHVDGQKYFLKAMDYTRAFNSPDTLAAMNAWTSAYIFERNVCEKCRDRRLKRVVHAVEAFTTQATPGHPFSKVECLVFELAEGDVRAHLDKCDEFDIALVLRALHHVATGLEQLHKTDIAHQDLKPSNVLVFDQKIGNKISDFGRAWAKDFRAAHDDYPVAGDLSYAPPELLYRQVSDDVSKRRFGCDTYHLGSLATFFFTRSHMNALLAKHLAPEHIWLTWGGSYSEVLPYVQAAFGLALEEFAAAIPADYRSEMTDILSYLCQPNPAERGHPLNGRQHAGQFSLDRFISRFDCLALRAEIRLKSGKK
jgi:serine/threonine protein kinase